MPSTTPLNFAPYSEPPDAPSQTRWAPPPPAASSSSAGTSYQSGAPVSSLTSGTGFGSSSHSGYAPLASNGGGAGTSGYEVTLWRHDWESAACYALGPFGAAAMLVFEIENDYVRFHAYQSVLLNLFLVLLHLFFLLPFGRWAQYLLVIVDLAALTLMSLRAYHDSDHLDRFRLPLIGELADGWVQAE